MAEIRASQELAASVHAKGLKFGVHIVRGIPRESVTRNLPIESSAVKARDAADQSDTCPWDPTSWGIKDTADMLPVDELRPYPDVGPGARQTRLTPAEQQTQLSLWVMARSPLIIGANLTLLDESTLRLLGNPDILKIDQTEAASRQVLHEGDLVIWSADLPDEIHALAAFNLGEKAIRLDRPLSDFGSAGLYDMKHAWTGERTTGGTRVSTALEPHASAVWMLNRK